MRNVSIQAKEAQGVMDLHSMNDSVMTNMEKPRYTLRRKEEKLGNDTPFFKVRTANTRLEESIRMEKPKHLFGNFVIEGEVTVLFAPTNVGKSVLALQIADAISQGKGEYGFESELTSGENVALVDLENTDQQFAGRYSGHQFSDNLKILEVPTGVEYTTEQLLSYLKNFISAEKSKVIVFDNISFMGNLQSANEAMAIIKALRELRDELGITILVVAHTNKKDNKPMTINDLAGSAKVGNLIDAAFALGRVVGDTGLRYIKQLKARSGEKIYEDPVMVVELVKENGLHFEYRDTDIEQNLLKKPKEDDEEMVYHQVWHLHKQGLSCRKIESELGISKSKVNNIVNAMKKREESK
jgi:RecA-family ATPase